MLLSSLFTWWIQPHLIFPSLTIHPISTFSFTLLTCCFTCPQLFYSSGAFHIATGLIILWPTSSHIFRQLSSSSLFRNVLLFFCWSALTVSALAWNINTVEYGECRFLLFPSGQHSSLHQHPRIFKLGPPLPNPSGYCTCQWSGGHGQNCSIFPQ